MGLRRALKTSRFLRAIIIVAGLFVLLPYALVPLYRFIDPVSTLMVWRWVTGRTVSRTFVPLPQIAPALPQTVIVAEDARFFTHRGLDFTELRGIIEEADDFDQLRGGSTVTQQTVKNLFLWHGRSVFRKILELPLALWTDLLLPKRRIMEIYLNIVEWGPNGQFGAEAGSRFAFGKSSSQIRSGEAALLAAILPNPKLRSARQPRSDVQRLAGLYLSRASRSPQGGACVRVARSP
jgi:monofunctional biosynthetic peptidoglycan transglycosylase